MKKLFFIIILFLSFNMFGQNVTKISIKRADKMNSNPKLGKDVQRLIGNVVFKHGTTLLYCDSAYFYGKKNSLTAFDNVHLNNKDSLHIYGDKMIFDGNTHDATITDNVKMIENNIILKTDYLIYNMKSSSASYQNGGVINDNENELTSEKGKYYKKQNIMHFWDDVVLVNPDYTMKSDTLHYNYNTKVSYFFGPTTIVSDDNLIYCENGWYNTEQEVSQYNENAYILNKEQKLSGDSIYYDRINGIGKAFNNVEMIDTVENIILRGNLCEYFENDYFSYITDSAHALIIGDESDTLFLHSDTIYLKLDSNEEAEFVFSYYNVAFYKKDLQGKCDSLVYNFNDSLMEMYEEPVLWSEEHQLSGNHIMLIMDSLNNPDSLIITNSAFILSKDSLEYYNQVKGSIMIGRFKDKELRHFDVFNNAESIYFARDENKKLIGVNNSKSDYIKVDIINKKVKRIKMIVNPDAILYPIDEATEKQKKLDGYNNQNAIRPKSKFDIF